MIDALTEQRHLHFRRAGVRLMKLELLYDPVPLLLSNSHNYPLFFSLSLVLGVLSNILVQRCKADPLLSELSMAAWQ